MIFMGNGQAVYLINAPSTDCQPEKYNIKTL